MEKGNCIEIKGLSKRFRVYDRPLDRLKEWLTPLGMSFHWAYWALKDLDLTIPKGSACGIVGVNGAGKSTLLKILCGTLAPTEGSVEIEGRIAGLLELGSGFHPEFTGRQNIYLNARLLGLTEAEIEKKLPAIVEFAELGDFLDHPLRIYSTGMALRLGFSVAANVNPDILIIDEALAVGDAYFQQKCLKYLKDFREQGGTLLFVSHDPGAVKLLCDTAVLLHHGKIVANDTPENVLNYYNTLLARRGEDEEAFLLEQKQKEAREKKPEHSGSFEAIIDSLGLVSEGIETRTLFSGKPAQLSVSLTALSDIPAPTVGFSLRDRLGYEIIGTNTFLQKIKTPDLKAGERLEVTFDLPTCLGPGEYTVTAAAHDGRDHIACCYDWTDKLLAFKVVLEKESGEQGLLNLPIGVSVSKVEKAGEKALDALEATFGNAPSELLPTSEKSPYFSSGFYEPEKLEGRLVVWTGPRAVFILKAKDSSKLVISCAAAEPQLRQDGLMLSLRLNGGEKINAVITEGGFQKAIFNFPKKQNGVLRCVLEISKPFVPARDGLSDDRRELGILIEKMALE